MMPNVVLLTCMRQRGVTRLQSGAQLEEGRSTSKQFGAVENLGEGPGALESASQMEVRPRMASKWEAFSERP